MKSALVLVALLLPLTACSTQPDNRECAAYFSGIEPEDTYSMDLAKLADYPRESPIHSALLKKRIDTPCHLLMPDHDSFAVASGIAMQPWIIFVSKAMAQHHGETLEGSNAYLVTYGSDGMPLRQSRIASLLTHEGFGLARTALISRTGIDMCDQEMEFFEYSENGDIKGLLDVPVRTTCKVSRAAP